MSLSYFASPAEQIDWLLDFIAKEGAWCSASYFIGTGFRHVDLAEPKQLNELPFVTSSDTGPTLYVGLPDIAQIVWQKTGKYINIDFIASQAVQIVASAQAQDRILVQGWVGIAPAMQYEKRGIDPTQVKRLYSRLCRSLKGIMSKEYFVAFRSPDGQAERQIGDYLTPAAVTWYRSGGLLKQSVQTTGVFRVAEEASGKLI